MTVRKGDKFTVVKEFRTIVLVQWFAPFTSGEEKTIPAGLTFVVCSEPADNATAVSAKPDSPESWEAAFVDEPDRNDPKYGGYFLVVPFTRLETHCSPHGVELQG